MRVLHLLTLLAVGFALDVPDTSNPGDTLNIRDIIEEPRNFTIDDPLQAQQNLFQPSLPIGKLDLIVKLADTASVSAYLGVYPEAKDYIKSTFAFGKFKGFSGAFDSSFLSTLRRCPWVVDISPDVMVHTTQRFPSSRLRQNDAPRHLARLWSRRRLPDDDVSGTVPADDAPSPPLGTNSPLWFVHNPYNTENVHAYVIDTGINVDHPEFGGRAKAGADFTGEGSGDTNGHGTHVAGLVGSRTYGVAKRINIIEVKVLGRNGDGSLSQVIAGIDFAANDRARRDLVAVANLSLGATYNRLLNDAIDAAVDSGLPVVVAAGNSGVPACTSSPASSSKSITVGAIDDRGDTIASFSNYGSCVDIFASGVFVQSLSNDYGTMALSGTSMAAPIVAGVVGTMLAQGVPADEVFPELLRVATYDQIPRMAVQMRPFTKNIIASNRF
ncbi:peptidase S8/S53 domain-containing protein [Yarrowia lipolytica]|uniref:Peptidase S8/S53 domain-containing protein n=1 Tax=Yarrowia lipolytica TaxID=4952 RepID=A0A1D8NPT3_YARLL|nr:hypothetical protein YALI1_F31832g [Yarrowia lipolytica]KAB8284458.1 peptidase S8/S53 domain-containing protein [Yarrowia lipolytica]KAE8174501.1 peptidase S8/S53 domain-containing protein [Yarrowia lipolytica]KAJ8055288.1 peptidase S8/S53 domain-containing protein [Yarrowia lipolytica]QNP99704.1 Subtilase-type proteinase RRT12 [Yarrowia lipolytica]